MTDLEKFQRSDSLCFTSPQTALLISLKNKNFEEFENLFKRNVGKNIDVNYLYEDPDNKTLLDVACSSKRNAKFVDLLLKYGANINVINKLYKKGPVHLAVEYSDLDTLKLLVENCNIDINLPDRSGNTALHLAVLNEKADFVKLLLKHPDIEVNKTNRKSQTPLHIAISKNNRNITEILLQNVNTDLDEICDFDDQTCRSLISSKFPAMEMREVRKITKPMDNLFTLLYNRDLEGFSSRAKAHKFHLDEDDGENTYLQYACKFGLESFVRIILNLGANPNKCSSVNKSPPIMIAAYHGYHVIVQILVDTGSINYDPVDGDNTLHAVLNGVMTCHRVCNSVRELGSSVQGSQNYYKCLEYLLNNVPSYKLDLNLPDKKGNTVLHYAFRADSPDMIRLLLEKGAYIGHKNFKGEMPVKFMNAETLKHYLDDSISTNGNLLGEEDYEIIFKYHLLAPPKQYLTKNRKTGYSAESGVEDEYEVVSETEPLVAMSEVSELRPLLKHPLITTFLNLKWYTINKYFWVNVAFYVTFWFLLTVYLLFVYGPTSTIVANQTSTNSIPAQVVIEERNNTLSWCLTLTFCSMLFLREFFQFSISTWRYIKSPENWIEISLIITSFVILLCNIDSSDTRAQLSAVAIILSWMELVLLIGRHPVVSTYVEMFKVVTWNFLKFLAWYSVLILAFALCFYLLFKDRQPTFVFFTNPGLALFKSAVMSTGEYDVSNIPFGDNIGTGHVVLVLFIFLISIVLFNLLNGLAVSDTQAIRMDAELVSIVCRAKLITYIETMAVSDPFPYLNILNKLTCFCCCVPIRRHSESRKKHLSMFYNRINLFPSVFPDREVRVLVNQDNRVVLPHSKMDKAQGTCFSYCDEWRIQQSIIKETKHLTNPTIETESTDQREVSQAITNLKEFYEMRLKTLENASKKAEEKLKNVEDSSKRTEQQLNEIMKLLKQKL